jgi:hypothetical protein
MTSLPAWTDRYTHTASDNEEQLFEALSIAWETLDTIGHPPKVAIAQNDRIFAKEAMRRIEELGK